VKLVLGDNLLQTFPPEINPLEKITPQVTGEECSNSRKATI